MAVVPSGHPRAGTRTVDLADLADDPWVLPRAAGFTAFGGQVLRACAAAGFDVQVAQEAPDLPWVLGLVAGGLGLGVVPLGVARLTTPGVSTLGLSPEDRVALPAALIWHRRRPPVALDHLIDATAGRRGTS